MNRKNNITAIKSQFFSMRRAFFIILVMLILSDIHLMAQVITNEGAAISLTPGIVVGTKDMFNNGGGNLINNGTIDLSGNYTSVATTGGDGLYRLSGNWTNTGGIFLPGLSTVIFRGSANQFITRNGGETFYNLSISNSGISPANRIGIANDVNVSGTLAMSTGNIDAATYILYLTNQAAASLNYTSITGSRIFGKFERGINQSANYLFPLGTATFYNPANLRLNNIVSPGSVLSQFITSPVPGNSGLPYADPPVEIAETFPDGFWSLTAKNLFSSNDFNINLNATGFADTVWSTTRVIKRTAGGNWIVDGTHRVADTVNNIVYRDNLTGDLSSAGTEFALGRAHPLITNHPVSLIQCEHTDAIFTVTATGATPLTYRWYKDGVIISHLDPNYSGARTSILTVRDIELSDAGDYYCVVSDRYRNKTTSNTASLIVNKIPVATVSTELQPHECSSIAFDNIVLGESYGVPGTTYVWTRNEPADIITAIPASGNAPNIGDILGGVFTNTSDDPITITFTITPIGPLPTQCIGLPIQSSVTVNPTPRVIPVNIKPEMCYGGTTDITLTTPTHMTRGTIMFDYTVSVTGAPGAIVGNTAPAIDWPKDIPLRFVYQNNADTMNSVFYSVLPKNVASGCNSGPVVIPEVKVHPKPMQLMYLSTPFTCTGSTAGVLTTLLSKIAKPDKIHWIRDLLSDTIYYTDANTDNLAIHYAGFNYQVTVTDNFGCVNASPKLRVKGAEFNTRIYLNVPETSCPGAEDGEIWVWEENIGSTAVLPLEFWLVRNGADTVSHDTIMNKGYTFRKELTSLRSGHYQLFIKDANGCYNGDYPAVDIVDPDPITVEFEKSGYSGGYNVSCLNYSDGSVSVKTISGGNGNFRYKWTKYNDTLTVIDTNSTLTGISAGKYYLLTTDSRNCTKLDSVILTQPAGISLVGTPELSWSANGDYNISCAGNNNGSIKIAVTGGSGNYNYLWSNGLTTRDISNLVADTYIATIRDQSNNECIMLPQPTITLTEPDTLRISAVSSISADGHYNINCYNGTGSVDITITGGSPGTYTYTWSTEDGSGIISGQEDQNSITAGTYHLIVRDANGCQAETNITLTQPAALVTLLIPTHITCASSFYNNGAIDLTVSGGISPFNYSWSDGESTEDITGLIQGNYIVTVTDFNGCIRIDSVRVNLPPPVEFTSVSSDYNGYNVSCNGSSNGSIDITTTSGLAPYAFNWQKIDDAFTSISEDISGRDAGQYSLRITDANLCVATDTIEITEPGKLDMNIILSSSIIAGNNINCAGTNTGTIDVVPVNQVGTARYLWSDGVTSQNRQNLFAGSYGIIITDSNNCLADSTVTLIEPDSLKLNFRVSPPWCSDKPDGEIRLTVTGGVVGTDYTYRWSDNSTGRNITDIVSGLYKVTVSDLNGCSIKDSVYVEPQHETCLIIPNAISPNGDLVNDVWNIGLIELYPQVEIKIFNRWGEIIWRSEKGYPQPWDGKSNGKALPIDSYHYIIEYNNGRKPIVGNVTIVR